MISTLRNGQQAGGGFSRRSRGCRYGAGRLPGYSAISVATGRVILMQQACESMETVLSVLANLPSRRPLADKLSMLKDVRFYRKFLLLCGRMA